MKSLVQYAQLVNTGFSIADTSRSLVSGRSGSAHSVSELSGQIDGVNAHLTSEIRSGVAAVLQQGSVLQNMMSTVSEQQAVLHQEIQQVIHGVASLNTLIQKHAHVIDEQLRFIIDEPLQNARHQLTDHLANKGEGVGITATDDEIRPWLRTLKTWLDKDFAKMQKLAAISSSEESVLFLSQPSNTDNIAFIAGRLHLLFGARIPEKFLLLPPVSLKFYYLIATLYLKTLEKNPNLMAADKAQPISQKILDTLKTYLEFSKFLKDNPELIEALFNLYDSQRDLVGNLSSPLARVTGQFDKQRKAALDSMEEARLLLSAVVGIIEGETPGLLTQRFLRCDSTEEFMNGSARNKKQIMTLAEKYRFYLRNQDTQAYHEGTPITKKRINNGSQLVIHYEPKGYIQAAEDMYFIRLCQPRITEHDKTWGSWFNDTSQQYFSYEKMLTQPRDVLDEVIHHSHNIPYTYGQLVLMRIHASNTGIAEMRIEFTSNFVKSAPGRSANCAYESGYEYGTGDFTRSLEETSLISNLGGINEELNSIKIVDGSPLSPEKLQPTYQYYVFIREGKLEAARLFLEKNKVDPYCLFFLISLFGYVNTFKHYSLPADFNYSFTLKGGSFTPLMIAAQRGREDVVNFLLHHMNRADLEKRSFDNKTAAQLAREQGFEDIAAMIENAQKGILPSVVVTPTAASDYEKGLEKMRADVEASKTKLGAYVPAPVQPVTQLAAAAISAQVVEPLPEEETGDEQENRLNKAARTFFTENNMHAGRTHFCHKSNKRPWRRPGFRFFGNDLFKDQDQRQEFDGFLRGKGRYFISREIEELDNMLLVELGTKTPARH